MLMLCLITSLASCSFSSRLPEIMTATALDQSQIDDVQKEFGFKLPEEASIALCRLSNSRDRLFTVIVCGVFDEAGFINDYLEFEVDEPYQIEHSAYNDGLGTGNHVMANYYFGMLNGSKRGVYVYSENSELIIELEKSGIVSKNLLDMF